MGGMDVAAAAVAGCRDGFATGDGQRQRPLAQHVQAGTLNLRADLIK
jgi:hypothetical protein